jgi:hypothetical protein|tara:strand:+ start:168 stop:794 length:627 start_codon:yes stop_codon:yes gene_type:complete
MALADELVSVASETSIGSGTSMITTFILLIILIFVFGGLSIVAISIAKGNKYNVMATIFIPTKAGYKIRKARAGVVKNPKTSKPEFRLKKPNMVINNYNAEWILTNGLKGLKGAFARDECYLINTGLNTYEMLNPHIVRENGDEIYFVAKNVGKDRLSEIMSAQVDELFTMDNFLSKYGVPLFYGSMVMVQIVMCIVLVQASNKILGA